MLKKYFSYLYDKTAEKSSNCLFSLLEPNKNASLMDCGCWDGENTKKYANAVNAKHVYGIEIDRQKSKEASAKGVIVRTADLNKKIPYKDNSFDVIIAYHVIEHLVNVRLFVSEIHRTLKKGGYVLIGTPNLASWHNVGALALGLQPFSGPTIMPNHQSEIGFVTEINQARMKKVFSKNCDALNHVKVMTCRELCCLLKSFKFNIENTAGF